MPKSKEIINELKRLLEISKFELPEGISEEDKYPFLTGYLIGSIRHIIEKYEAGR
ncbi:MAG: hypothetical protein PWR10_1818 [Halanaerobiales bacterium]|nr:hypothetical protein [Halanaerobiales bacterium]